MSRVEIQFSVPEAAPEVFSWSQLDRATLGDAGLAAEVLGLFDSQAAHVGAAIREMPPDAAMLVHGLKGAARSIGACAVADASERLEAALRASADPRPAVDALIRTIADTRRAIAAHLNNA